MYKFTKQKVGNLLDTACQKSAALGRIISLAVLFLLFSSNGALAQLSTNYTASKTSTGTFSPLTGGTVIWNASSTSMDDQVSGKIALPSTFNFNGANYDTIVVCTNGHLSFIASGGSIPAATPYTPISTVFGSGSVAAFAADLDKSAVSGSVPQISYATVGSEFVVEWQDVGQWNTTNTRISFQIRLNLCNNLIKVMYGAGQVVSSVTRQVGLRGTSNSDFLNWTITTGVWTTAATAGGANTSTCTWSTTCAPANGGSFTYTPTSASALALTSINYNTTSVSGVAANTNNNHIHRLDFNVTGLTGTLPLDSISITSLNTNDADITGVKLYATSTPVFSTATQIGTTQTFSSGVANFSNINYNLSCGTNYVWVTYDVSNSATNGNVLDAKYVANSIKVGSSYYPSTQKSPSGSRAVAAPMTFVSAVAANSNTAIANRTSMNQEILQVKVTMSASGASISLDSIRLNTLGNAGTNNPSTNISNAKLFYTGSTSTFATTTQYGSVISAPNGSLLFNGYQPMNTGDNYFYLTYDIQAAATLNDSVDASVTDLYVGGSNQTVSPSNPSGFRMIRPLYCVPSSTAQCCGFGITNVTLGSINNTTTPETGAIGYHDYTSQSTTLKKGTSYTVQITPGTYGSGNQNIAAWIDFNGDGDFIDVGEKIGEQLNLNVGTAYNYNFNVSCGATTGYTRLRVKHQYATTNIDPCANGNYVDVEDYTLLILDSALNYITSLATHSDLSDVPAGAPAVALRLPVVAKGCSGALNATSFDLSTSGSTNASADIDSAVIYYTGNSATYAASGRFGVAASPNGSFTINGSQALVADSNNFWLVYFVKGSASIGNVIDAQFSQITVNGNNYTPSNTNPSGNRTINTAMTFVSADGVQPTTAAVVKGTGNNPVVRLDLTMSSGYSVNLSQIKFNLVGSTSVTNDVANVKIYYTGNSATFATTTQFGSTITSGLTSNPITASGSVALVTGVNYFWITDSIKTTAVTGDSVDAQVTQVNIGGLNNVTTTNPAGKRRIIPAYCARTWSFALAGMGITNVSLGSINNTTANPTTAGTTVNFTNLSTDIQRKSSQTIQVTTGTYTYYNHMSVYIDYNQDGTFGSGEKVAEQVSYTAGGSPYTWSNTFTVPCSALLGPTRMRVINQYNTAATGVPYTDNPCGTTPTTTYGEAEDYIVNITDNPLTYVSSTAITSSTLAVSTNTTNNQILKMQVINAGCTGPLTMTSFTMNTNGSTDPSNDIDSVKIFYTGNNANFATTTLFGALGSQNGSYTMNGSVDMLPDTNYFHLVYRISSGATVGDFVDAQFISDVTNSITYYPSISSPSGDRQILNPMTYTSSTVAQPMLGNVFKSSVNNVIMQVQVVMSAGTGITADSISFNSTGSTSLSDFNNMKLFYTGNSSTFSTATLLSTVATSATTFKMFAGNTLSSGTNYYWLTYNIAAGATTNNKVDATINYVKIAGTSYTPSVTTITGDRNILPAYCTPSSTAQCCGFGITNVTLGSINNTTTPETTSGTIAYHNYTSQSTDISKQGSYSLSVKPGTYTGGNQNIAVWIDWNNDGDFYDSGEKLGEQTNMAPGTAYNYAFTVPCSAVTGTTIMRLKHQYATTNIDPCANGNYVDVEDYTVNIVDSALNFISMTTQQVNLTDVAVGTNNNEIARIKVITGGCSGSLSLTNLNLGTSGTTATSDITAAKVYFTGNSNVLSFGTQFGSTVNNPGATYSVSGSQNLVNDSNFFFVVYDISGSATLTNVVDAQCSQATIASTNYTPTVTSPSGNRQINSPMTYSSHSWSKAAGAIQKGSSNLKVATVVVNMSSGSSVNLDSLIFNTGASQNPSTNITSARVFFTGSSSTFATTTAYGSTINTPSGALTFVGSAALQSGANYFHLAYNVSATANSTTPDSLTGDLSKITVNGTDYSASPSSIGGKRKIINTYCLPAWVNSYVGMGISTVKIGAIDNVTGTPSGTGVTSNFTSQSTSLKRLASNSMRISNSTYDYYNTMSVWIDFNQDGVWQTTERVFMNKDVSGTGNNVADTFNFNFAVPCNAALGTTRMRVMMEYNGSVGTDAIGCGGVNGMSYGEAEDYSVDITDSAMSITNVTTQQVNLNTVAPSSTNAEIGRVRITTGGCGSNQVLTSLNLSTSGSTDAANDLTNASVYYTGTSNVFSTATAFGSPVSSPNGSFSVSGSQVLGSDSNFFFIAYDIASGATTGGSNVADVTCSQATISASNYTPTVTAPSGSRTIDVPMTYTSHTWSKDAGSIQKGATNIKIATVAITMGTGATINMDSIYFNTGGSQNPSTNITNAKVYFTGSSSAYSTATQYGATVTSPNGSMAFGGTAALQTGVNYFHLAYTVSASANSTTPDSLTGDLTSIKIAGSSNSATPGSIAGKRRIINAYCTPSSTAQCCGFAITNVTLGSINNTTTPETATGSVAYHNYQSMATNITKSASYSISVKPGTYTGGNQNIAAWIDWNSDGDFADAGEKIGEQTNLQPTVAYAYNFTVPCSAVTGSTVLRLKHQYATTNIDPCANGNYIDVEDYTLYIADSARAIVSNVSAHPSLVDVATGTTNVQMQRIRINTGGCSPSYTITQIDFDNGGDVGTTSVSDITAARAYYTTTSNFSTTTAFGSAISNPSAGTMTFTGSVTLPDSAWFWLVYDVSNSATISNALDAKVTNMIINSTNTTPTNANPTGARYINNPMTYVSSTVDMPNVTNAQRNTTNQTTVRLAVTMSSSGYPIKLDSIYARLAGSTNISTDLQNAKVFFTGNSATFATTTQLGSTVATPTGALLFASSTVFLANNVNYFWLTADVKNTATLGDSMTGVIDSFRTNLTTYVPSPTTVSTKRKIVSAYCLPSSSAQCCGFGITNVTLGSINNTSTPETAAGTVAYHNYTAQSTSLTKSTSYTMNVTPGTYTGGNQNIAAWIDWDQNGIFASNERLGELTNMAPNTAYGYTFTVPCSAIAGATRLRVVHQYATTNIDPCTTGNYVDAEDYTINVVDFNRSVTAVTTTTASTQAVGQSTTKNAILRVRVATGGCSGTLTSTQLDFNTNGSTDATNDITNAQVYFTGSSNTFATTTLFGATAAPNGSFSVTGSQNITTDSAFYWLTYDIAASSTLGNVVDADGSVVTVNSTTYGTSSSPAGDRTIQNPMSFVSATTTQASTASVFKGSVKQAIIGGQIVMSSGNASTLTMLNFTTSGSTNTATDVTNAKVYYTGNSSVFATTTQYGSAYNAPSYGFQVNGSQSLLSGTNYFWLTYDVPSNATTGNYLDATLEDFDIDSQGTVINYIPSTTNPTGDRKIIPAYCSPTWTTNLGAELGIKQVTVGTINNTTTAPNGAGNTVNYLSQSTDMQKGASLSMTVKTGTYTYYNNASVHIDWNADGIFQTSERVYDYYVGAAGGSQYTFNFNVLVPCNASLGTTRMRVINEYFCCTAPTTGGLACGIQTNYGEAEDYTVNITDSALSYISSTTAQPITSDVFANSSDKEIARLAIVMKGCSGTKTLTGLTLNTNGSSNASNDISNAKVYFTGSSSVFATTTLFGSTGSPNGSFTVSGSQAMSTDTNYLWIAYDISSGATTSNVVDVEVTDLTISGNTSTPTVSAPSGSRSINVPMTYSASEANMISTANINKSNRFGEILKLKVTMNSGASVPLTNLALNTTGSNNIGSNADTVRVFYTGTSNAFATSTLVGLYTGSLTGSFNVTGNQSLLAGDNYFWVTYSVKSAANTGDSLTGHVTQITVDGNTQTPTDNVVGKRRIIPAYCIGAGSNNYSTTMFMSRVKIGAIDNTTSFSSFPIGYNYYNTMTCSLAVGQSDTVKVQGGNTYNISVGVFIDLNQDGDFDDTGEKRGENQNVSFTGLNNIPISIPSGATPGLTRMRVRNNYQANTVTPCTTLTYAGETEDYNIYISPPPAPSPSITPSSSVTFCQSIGQVFSTTLNSSLTYSWKVNGSNVYSGTGSPYNQYNFNPGSTGSYTVQVTATDVYAQTGSSSIISVTVNANPVGGTTTAASPSICAGDVDSITVTGNSGSIQWQSKVGAGSWTNITLNGNSSVYVATPTVTTQYRAASTLGSCGTAYSNAVTVTIGATSVWSGNSSTDWRNATNWCNGVVPTASSIVVIPVRTNMPVLAASGTCSTLTINSGASLTLNIGANLIVNGLMTNNGTLTHNGGVLNLNSPQTVPGGNYFYLKLTGTSGEYKFNGNATVNNNFEIGSGTVVNDSGNTITVHRDIINNGTHKGNGKIRTVHTTSYQTASGNGIYGNFELANGATTGVRFVSTSTINKLLTLTSGTLIVYNGTTLTIGSNSTSTGNITFAAGTKILGANSASNSNLAILGNASSPEITGFNFTSAGSLTVNRPNGIKLGALCKVGGTLSISAGKLKMNGQNLYVGQTNTSNGFISTTGTGKISNASTTSGWLYIYGTSGSAAQITNLSMDSIYSMSIAYPLGVSLANSFRVHSTLQLPGNGGSLDLNSYTVTLSSTATLSESNHNLVYGSTGFITTTRSFSSALSNANIAGLGLVLNTNQSPGNTTLVRGHTLGSQSSSNSIRRYYTIQPSNHSGLIYNTMELRYDSVECGTGLTTPGRHVIAKHTVAGSTSGWTRVPSNTRASTLGAPYGYQYVLAKNVAGAASQVFTVFDSVSASLSSIIAVAPATQAEVATINEVNVWPNPFNTNLTMGYTVENDANITISMMDMSGKVINSQIVKSQKGYNTINIDGTNIPAGMYLINLIQNNEVKTFRVVKTN